MSNQYETQSPNETKLYLKNQSKDNQLLIQDYEIAYHKFSEVFQKNLAYEQEIQNLKNLYFEGVKQSQNREASLNALLEIKQQEISEQLNEISSNKNLQNKILQEKNMINEEISMLNSLKTSQLSFTPRCKDANFECFYKTIKDINDIGKMWRDTDEDDWNQCNNKIQALLNMAEDLTQKLSQAMDACDSTQTQNKNLQDYILDLESTQINTQQLLNDLNRLEDDKKLKNNEKTLLAERNKALIETLDNFKSEKESIANKLEEVHENLIKERLNSQEILELCEQEKESYQKHCEKLSQEQLINERLSEQVTSEKETLLKLKEEVQKTKDIDLILEKTTKDLGIEPVIMKTDQGYTHNNNPINLLLHNETFIIVKSGTDFIPLTDFLTTAYPPTPASKKNSSIDRKIENRPFDLKETEKAKSPIRTKLSTQPYSVTKTQKTPLRDRNTSQSDRKKPFK
jgi:hypothetical protein